jgi:hypothetical protein
MNNFEKIYELAQTMTDEELCDLYNKYAYLKILIPVREGYTRLFEEYAEYEAITFLRAAEPFNVGDEFFLIDLEHDTAKSIPEEDINRFVAQDKNVQNNYFKKENQQ